MEGYSSVDDPASCFSEQELEVLAARQRIVKASPLRKHTLLPFSLPSLYPKAVYDTSVRDESSTDTARHASQSLLKLLSDDKSGKINVRLVKGLQKGSEEGSQVWRGSIDVEGRKRKVVVKLFAAALFMLPQNIRDSGWFPAGKSIRYEAEGYASFQAEQGLGVPICYGFYQFDAPWGEEVTGVILEDLSEITIPLSTFAADFLRRTSDSPSNEAGADQGSNRGDKQLGRDGEDSETSENKAKEDAVRRATQLKYFIHELFKAHRRLQDRGFSLPISNGEHVLVLRWSAPDKPRFVFCALRRSMSEEEVKRESGEIDHRKRGEDLLKTVVKQEFGTQFWLEWEGFELFPFV